MTHTQLKEVPFALRRERFQNGSLKIEQRKKGPNVWVFRWREDFGNGQTIRRKKIVGTIDEIRNKNAAEKAILAFKVDLNATNGALPTVMTLAEVVEHFKLVELHTGNRTERTRETYLSYLERYILPKWGKARLSDVKTVHVERWLGSLEGAPATKSKIRAVMSMVFRHAMRYELRTSTRLRWYGNRASE